MKKLVNWFQDLFKNWARHDSSRYAAAIAFYTIFSLAPMLIVGVTIASWKFDSKEAQEEIFKYVEKAFGAESSAAVRTVAESIGFQDIKFDQSDLWASFLGLIILLMGASKVITELHDALNHIFDIKEESAKKKLLQRLRGRLVSMSVVIGLGLLLALSLFTDTLMRSLGNLVEDKTGYTINFLYILDNAISFLIIPILNIIYLKVLPARPIPLRHLWLGTIVSTLLFYVGKFFMSYYLSYSGITSTYGAAGSAIILLVWIYYTIEVILVGAEVCALSISRHEQQAQL